VELLLGDLLLERYVKAMKWLDAASLLIGNMLWIIISVKGNYDGKISSDKVCEIVDKIAKTRTFELYF
jgi:hypothetical protein